MSDQEKSQRAMALLASYEAEQELQTLRRECDRFIDTLNALRDWLRSAHREYSAFADTSHLDERFSMLHAKVIEQSGVHRKALNLDEMIDLVNRMQAVRARLLELREERSRLGIPEGGRE